MKTHPSFLLTCLMILLVSCQKDRYYVPGNRTVNIKIHRFDQAFQLNQQPLDTTFLYLYATEIMKVDKPGSKMYQDFYTIFHQDTSIARLYAVSQQVFKEVAPLEKQLGHAFYRLTYFLPEIPIPRVYMHLSAYGESIVSAPGILSASIDKYLGTDYPIYSVLFQPYQIERMYPEKILSDYLIGWIRSELTQQKLVEKERLLDYLIYEGKLLFLLTKVLPDEPMERLISFTPAQLAWCQKNEKKMWQSLIEMKHLYSTDRAVIANYLEEAPSTSYFPEESPGRAIVWTGYRIVESYMKRHPAISIKQLIYFKDAAALLQSSGYRP